MIKLRLRRMGAKKQPSYRIVAADSRKPRNGRFIETLGHYDPKPDPYTLKVDEERAKYWLEKGAQPTETVRALLVKSGVLPPYQGSAAASRSSAETRSDAGQQTATVEAEPAAEQASQVEETTESVADESDSSDDEDEA